MGDKTKIIVGLADIYIKTWESELAHPVASNALVTTGWTQLGFQSEDGLTEELTVEVEDLAAPNVKGKADDIVIDEGGTITFGVKDAGLLTEAMALRGATYTAGAVAGTNENVMGFGGKTGDEGFIAVAVVGKTRGGLDVCRCFWKCRPSVSKSRSYKHKGVSLVEFSLTCFVDTSQTAGEQIMKAAEITEAAA